MFKAGDWVLKIVLPNKRNLRHGKLAETWEGPYLIHSVVGQRAYLLQAQDGTMVPRSWNAAHLKLYHM